LGLAETVQEKNGPEGTKHLRYLVTIRETDHVVHQRSAQIGIHAWRQIKLERDAVLSLPSGASLNGYLQLGVFLRLAIQAEDESDGLIGGETLVSQQVDAGGADVFDAGRPGGGVDAIKGRKTRCGPSFSPWLLRLTQPL
jgi:hypothetical protein